MNDELDEPTADLVAALRDVLRQVAEPHRVLATILELSVRRTGADRGLFVEVRESGELDYRVLHGFTERHFEGDAGAFSRHVFGRVVATGREVVLENASRDPDFGRVESVRALRTGAVLCMPIRADGRVAALVHLENRRAGHFTKAHVEPLRALLAVAGPVLAAMHAGSDAIHERDRLRHEESRLRREAEETREQLAEAWGFGSFVGRSAAVRDLESAIAKAAGTGFPVLLTGEVGTGKSLLAKVLHSAGPRARRPFVTLSCPSLERGLVEAELFGHRRGAFTGAIADRAGRVQVAEGGTLFLDEIGDLPSELQPKLLRLLQERTYERVGDPVERTADVRVIAATNKDLVEEMREGRFRRDLYDRLNFLPIRVPPLRERTEDIPLLLRHCLDRTPAGRWIEVPPATEEYLAGLDFSWPGNVRRVEQLAARLTTEGLRGPVLPQDVDRLLDRSDDDARPAAAPGTGAPLPSMLADAERRRIEQEMARHPGLSRSELAAKLGIAESTLFKKLKKYREQA